MTSTPTPEPAKITCPDCGGHPSEPKLRTEGGSLSCSFCNRTLTFNFMRDNEPEHRACACRASRNARCQTCGGDGEIDVRPAPSTPGEGTGRPLPEFQMVACADHMLTDHRWRCRACRREVERQFQECCEEMWRLQRTTPAPPASPVPPTPTPQADRDKLEIDVEELLIDHCGMGGTSALTDRILALTDAFTFAAAPPSTPAEQPDPDGLSAAELLADLKDRTERGMVELEKLAAPLGACMERTRLLGKLAGLALVADWLRSYDHPTDPTGSEA